MNHLRTQVPGAEIGIEARCAWPVSRADSSAALDYLINAPGMAFLHFGWPAV
jgi:hypothetical protein